MAGPRPGPPPAPVRRFARSGALGFGLGGALGGVLVATLAALPADAPLRASGVVSLGFGLMGALGGAALGLAARDSRLLRRLLLTGLLGFGPLGLVGLLLAATLPADPASLPPLLPPSPSVGLADYGPGAMLYAVAFGARGALGGALMGLAVPHRHAVRILALLGFLGFAAGGVLSMALLVLLGTNVLLLGRLGADMVWLGITAAVGGAVLGAGVGRLAPPCRPS